ncbi:hypothetical protein OsI_20161 [Oryza sativa Indica Group]|uniref:Uncharacterized protein n=1 Tax=Oryza sativa subsp. indica TaxID=39946 RepID=B8AYS2_ORYSI|nr:hypothetical protein OsI_20161 [Oryza sativa Indica Group]
MEVVPCKYPQLMLMGSSSLLCVSQSQPTETPMEGNGAPHHHKRWARQNSSLLLQDSFGTTPSTCARLPAHRDPPQGKCHWWLTARHRGKRREGNRGSFGAWLWGFAWPGPAAVRIGEKTGRCFPGKGKKVVPVDLLREDAILGRTSPGLRWWTRHHVGARSSSAGESEKGGSMRQQPTEATRARRRTTAGDELGHLLPLSLSRHGGGGGVDCDRRGRRVRVGSGWGGGTRRWPIETTRARRSGGGGGGDGDWQGRRVVVGRWRTMAASRDHASEASADDLLLHAPRERLKAVAWIPLVLLSDLGVAELPLGENWNRPQRIDITALFGGRASTGVGVGKSLCVARVASVEIPGGYSANGRIIEPGLEVERLVAEIRDSVSLLSHVGPQRFAAPNTGKAYHYGRKRGTSQLKAKRTEKPCQRSAPVHH